MIGKHVTGVYRDPAQEAELKAAFKPAEDLPLDAIGTLIAAVTPEALIERSKSSGR